MSGLNRDRHVSAVKREITSAFSKSRTGGNGRPSEFILSFSESLNEWLSNSTRKHEILTRSLRKMERTLDTVLKSIGNPSIVSGMISRSPSPSAQLDATQALMSQTESPSPTYYQHRSQNPPSSPKLHSLPDNSLNPLGLLAEASLANRRAQVAHPAQPSPGSGGDPPKAMGVASDAYFKPGMEVIRSLWCPPR